MKILQNIQDYIKYAIENKNVELEFIYGSNNNSSINKEKFLNLLKHCKENFKFLSENNILDIRKEILLKNKKHIGSTRCSIHGLKEIQNYCKTEKIEDAEYIKKQNIQGKKQFVDKDYNYRINIKTEETLREQGEDVKSFLVDFQESKKHYRYKKRYSFLTHNKIFRIDLTVVKSSKKNKVLQSYELYKTFVESKVLKEPETFEIEIEYIGNNTIQGIKNLSEFLNSVKDELVDYQSFQPLDPSLSFVDSESKQKSTENIIGEYVTINDEYLKTLDKKTFTKLSGQKICYVSDLMIIGDLTYTMLDIPDMDQLIVPITEVYNESWNLGELKNIYKVKTNDSVLKKINEGFNDIIYDILCQINQTKLLVSKTQKNEILDEYYKLTNQETRKNKVFMAPQPVTLNLSNLYDKNPINILNNYAVTEKADGQRYLLYINKSKRGYLINTKLDDVLDIGVEFPNIKAEWVLDGEYIQKDKNNQPIQLFMIFDVYYADLKDDPYKLPYYDETNLSREKILEIFDKEYTKNMKIVDQDFDIFRIYNKKYHYSINTYDLEQIDKSILLHSKFILDKNNDGGFEYSIDGLIYLPLKLPVKSDLDGKPQKFINGAWKHNFKWKPPEENTIDFKISTVKQTISMKNYQAVRDKKIPYTITDDDGNQTINYYKQVKLIVAYDETQDTTLDYNMKILETLKKDSKRDKNLIVFNPPNSNQDYGKTNVKLTNGKIICEKDKREVQDGDIVEMMFDENDTDGFMWIPLKLRSDKLKPQWFLAANNVWSTITYPISTSMISGNIDLETIKESLPNNANDDLYYVKENENVTSSSLRKLHNFIKYNLITGICDGQNVNIMDTSIGQGGDLKKYIQKEFKCEFLFGLDLNSTNEASRRFYNMAYKKPKAVFIRYDTSKNIKDGEGIYNTEVEKDIEHSEHMINILYGLNKSIPENYKNIRAKYNKLCLKKFDLISCQFSLHYYFESVDKFNGFLSNLTDNCKPGGYFIGTCYDGKKLSEMLKSYKQIEYKDKLGNLVYSIKKQYTEISLKENLFGNKIDVYMESIGEEYSEYLVDFDKFVEIMNENGFELYKPKISKKYDIFDGPINSFSTIIEKLPSFKLNKHFMKYYSDSLKILNDDKLGLLSSLNNYFIFKRK
jgi:hypothetical protein